MGELLRFIAIHREHHLHNDVSWHLNQGILITQDIIADVIRSEIDQQKGKGIIFDGAVRNRGQLETYSEVEESYGRNFTPVIVLTSMANCINRLMIKGRGDDYDEMVIKRLNDFNQQTMPVITGFELGEHIKVINENESDTPKAIRSIENSIGISYDDLSLHNSPYLNTLYREVHKAREYYDTAWRGEIRRNMFSAFIRTHGGKDIVDLGCRDGFLNYDLVKGKNITAVDIDEEALRRYRIRYAEQNPTVYHHDLNYPLEIPDQSQDIVIAGETLEHLTVPDRFIGEVYRILRPNGIFIGSTPNAFKLDKRIRLLLGKDPKDFSDRTHLQYFSESSLIKMLGGLFEETEIFPYAGDKKVDFMSRVRADGFIWRCIKK